MELQALLVQLVLQEQLVQLVLQAQLELQAQHCLLYTSPSPRDATLSRMPSSA